MKKAINYIVMLMVVAVAASCSKSSNGDADSLLRTIPADASSVAILNLEQTIKSLGGNTDGKTIEFPKDFQNEVAQSKAISDKNKQIFTDICAGETGVSVTSLAFFASARSYVTGLLDDPDKFVSYVQRRAYQNSTDTVAPPSVEEKDGARVIDDIVVVGNQFWICTEGTADIEQLKYYQKLNENQSYASSKAAPLLLEAGKVVTFVADVKRNFDRMPESTYMRMAASLVFDDIAYIAGSAHFDKKDLLSESVVLSSEMKPAELLLPTEKIDPSVVKSLNKNGDVFLAAGLPKKLTKKIADMITTTFGATASSATSPIQQIDGTTAICMDINTNSVEARIQTTGNDFASLSNMIQIIPGTSVTRDGDMLTVKYGGGVSTGNLTASDAASKLKGAWIGFMGSDLPSKGMTTVARLIPDNKSLKLDVEIEGGLDALLNGLLK